MTMPTPPFPAGAPAAALAQLRSQVAAGTAGRLMPFWGHRAAGPGAGPWVLSQWWPVTFTVDEVTYHHAEGFMMAAKARLFHDDATLERILAEPDPKKAKDLGRAVRGFDRATWMAHAYTAVVAGNVAKFTQHPDLGAFLAWTAPGVLVEASPYDRVWGVGLAKDHPDIGVPERWRGPNLLGFALMEVRDHHLAAASPVGE